MLSSSQGYFVSNALGMLELLPMSVFGEFLSDVDPTPIGIGTRMFGDA